VEIQFVGPPLTAVGIAAAGAAAAAALPIYFSV
jgi:hypothetical protein